MSSMVVVPPGPDMTECHFYLSFQVQGGATAITAQSDGRVCDSNG